LYEIYEQNEPSANKKFKGKVVSVSGQISSIGKDMIGKFNICLKTKNSICGIQCFFDKAHKKRLLLRKIPSIFSFAKITFKFNAFCNSWEVPEKNFQIKGMNWDAAGIGGLSIQTAVLKFPSRVAIKI